MIPAWHWIGAIVIFMLITILAYHKKSPLTSKNGLERVPYILITFITLVISILWEVAVAAGMLILFLYVSGRVGEFLANKIFN